MPVPRRFDRRPPERDTTRINERIRVPEVRLIDEDGEQVGVMRTDEALRYAQERDLDLVEVAPEARPPVCRVLDYSKYKYEQAQKQKAARKHQQQITIREIKFRPKIAQHDYDTKKGHVERFLRTRTRSRSRSCSAGARSRTPSAGVMILDRLAEELADLAIVEQRPNLDGRNMTMMLGPSKAVLSGQYDSDQPPATSRSSRPTRPATSAEAPANGTAAAEEPAAEAPATGSRPRSRPRGAGERVAAEEPAGEPQAAGPSPPPARRGAPRG